MGNADQRVDAILEIMNWPVGMTSQQTNHRTDVSRAMSFRKRIALIGLVFFESSTRSLPRTLRTQHQQSRTSMRVSAPHAAAQSPNVTTAACAAAPPPSASASRYEAALAAAVAEAKRRADENTAASEAAAIASIDLVLESRRRAMAAVDVKQTSWTELSQHAATASSSSVHAIEQQQPTLVATTAFVNLDRGHGVGGDAVETSASHLRQVAWHHHVEEQLGVRRRIVEALQGYRNDIAELERTPDAPAQNINPDEEQRRALADTRSSIERRLAALPELRARSLQELN